MEKFCVLFVFVFFGTNVVGQVGNDVNIVLGFNSFSYINDGNSVSSDPEFEDYFSTQAITPFIGMEVVFKKVNLGLRATYYSAPISTPFSFADDELYDVKRCGAVDVDYRWEHFRLGLILATRDYRRQADRTAIPGANIQYGVGFKFATVVDGFELELRKEMAVVLSGNTFDPGLVGLLDPMAAWNMRLSYPIGILPSKSEEIANHDNHKHVADYHGLNVQLGTSITGNPNYEFSSSSGRTNLVYTFGFEYFISSLNMGFLYRRAQSLRLNTDENLFSEYIQNNYLGVSYWIPISSDLRLKMDLLHNWSFNRLTQTTINEEFLNENPTQVPPELFGDYHNRSIGVVVRYPIVNWVDVYGQFDYYYSTDNLSKKGFSRNSLAVGVLLYLNP